MKLIIAGSRDLNPSCSFIYGACETLGIFKNITKVVSGAARGVDSAGEDFAKYYNIDIATFPANWNKYKKAAGVKRNLQMGNYGDALLLIWDGESKGSASMKTIMKKLNKPIYEIILK